MSKPRIHLIATGGTIAGVSASATDTTAYRAGSLTAQALLDTVPPLAELAELSVEQLYNLDSKDMSPQHWLGLARAARAALERDEVDGVVITHGTDTLEESAFFLDLVLPPGKPVVFTCAMRPSSALSADGPMNLYGAVAVACSAEAAGLGVLVVSNDRIHTAREATKAHPQALDAFVSPDTGPLGWARPPTFLHRPVRGAERAIELDAIDALPQVEILTVAAGSSPRLLNACIGTGARGIILALPGNSSLPQSWEAALAAARAAGCSVLVASRTGADPRALTPLKARVRLITTLLDEE